jgi:putative nucleotidyltransferase with HDIG domain
VTYRLRMRWSPWAAVHADELLVGQSARWTHTKGVARQARILARSLPSREDRDVLVAAAYLHDIGYASAIRLTGFHPLDGAVHLRALNRERLARLVAFHSGARWEAELRGLDLELARFEPEVSEVADGLTYCDVTTGPNGEVVTLAERLADVEARHGTDSLVVRALRLARADLERAVSATESALAQAR